MSSSTKRQTAQLIAQGEINKSGLGVGMALGWYLDEPTIKQVVEVLERGLADAERHEREETGLMKIHVIDLAKMFRSVLRGVEVVREQKS